MRYTGGSTEDHDAEVEEVRWFPLEEAERTVAYPTEAQMLEKARERLAAK
jgi:NADH pyrophosphatase NudC (nudix superfamily)